MANTTQQFDPNLFRQQHRPEAVEPLRDGAQTRLDGRTRAVVYGIGDRIVYDSQREHAEAGIFARDEAIEHGMCWIEARIRLELRREQLEAERRFALADIEAGSQKREADLRLQRTDLTKQINRERKIQAALAAEARDPKVRLEFGGGIRFEVIDEPSVFDGTLDAEGRPIQKPKPRGETPPPANTPPPPPAAADPVEGALSAKAKAAAMHKNGTADQASVVTALEKYSERIERGTLAAIALGERDRKKPRAALDSLLRSKLDPDTGDRDGLIAMIEGDGSADFAAASLLTSSSDKLDDLRPWLAKIEDCGVLHYARDREQERAKPRAEILDLVKQRLAVWGSSDERGAE
jgi:hypothetical protein